MIHCRPLLFLTLVHLFLISCHFQKISGSNSIQHIEYVLSGNISEHGATITIKADRPSICHLILTESQTGIEVLQEKINIGDGHDYTIKREFNTLRSKTRYTYEVYSQDKKSMQRGSFTTFDIGAFSYKIVFGSCMETGSSSDIFLKIRDEKPLFFLQGGDLHYENIDSNCTPRFNEAYTRTFTSSSQRLLYQSVPLVYMWDDHDFGPNNADSGNPCLKAAVTAYDSHIPHYPYALTSDTGPISQVFEAGRVVYVLTDLRSQKIRPEYNGCERIKPGTNFGNKKHLNWFFDVLLRAKKEGKVVAWFSSYAWINAPGGPNYSCKESDNWGGYPEERTTIANFITDNEIPLFIMSGDAHMVAIDDGSNSAYSDHAGSPIRVFHAAALDRYGSNKGGPYSHGYSKEPGQYGVIEVLDSGQNQICFLWYGKNKAGQVVTNQQGKAIKLEFCIALPEVK